LLASAGWRTFAQSVRHASLDGPLAVTWPCDTFLPRFTMIELRTLGGLQLTSAGTPVESVLAQPRRTALLCYLALATPRGFHARDKLYALFWPEHDARHARHALRQSLYFLRRALGANTIVSRGDGALALSPDHVSCDAWEFERAVDEERPEDALALYGDDLLAGFHVSEAAEFERWLDEQRSGLRHRAADAAWLLSESHERAGNAAGAAEWARRAAAFYPADETTLRRQMSQLDRLGDRSAALRVYQRFARNLEREYELQPSAETRALLARICTPDTDAVEVASGAALQPVATTLSTSETAPLPAATRTLAQPQKAVPTPTRQRLRDGVRYGGFALLLAVIVVFAWLAVRQDIARTVARELGSAAGQRTTPPLRRVCTRNVAANEFYLRGSNVSLVRTLTGTREAEKYLKQAILADSTCAAAYARLAQVYLRITQFPRVDTSVSADPTMTARQGRALAMETALKAIALDDSTAQAHLVLGGLLLREFEFARAEVAMKRAFQLDSTYDRSPLIHLYILTRRPAHALDEAERWLKNDSSHAPAIADVAQALLANDRCDEALARLERLAGLDPPLLRTAPVAAQCYGRKRMWLQAIKELQVAEKERGMNGQALIAFLQARAGNQAAARHILNTLLDHWDRHQEGAFHVAVVYAGLADFAAAFDWLNKSIEDHSLNELIMHPLFEELHRDPRFDRLMERLGL
jgi:DNA-binding SARP family transcriptional activator